MQFIVETSGSTGSAKRVLIDEESCLALAETEVSDLGINKNSIVMIDSWKTGGLQRVFWARVSGCRLAVFPGHEKASMREWITENRITHLATIATRFRWLASGIYRFPAVKVLEIGGEMVDWADVVAARKVFPNAVFFNRYSCSEARVIARKRVEHDDPIGLGRMPVGKPIKGVEIQIIDGPMGEIAVKSPYMSLGYYDDPELTAAKFKNGWYHTGDYGHFLPDGDLMHDGRKDFAGEVRAKFNELSDSERLDRNINTIMGSL